MSIKEKRIRKLIVLKEQYEAKMHSIEEEAKETYWQHNTYPIQAVMDDLEMLTEYNNQSKKLLAIDDFLFKFQKEYYDIRNKIKQEKELVEEKNEMFVRLNFSYTKEEFIDTLQSTLEPKEFEKIKSHISDFADYFMRKIDCSCIYDDIIGSMDALAQYFLENLN